MKQQYHFSKTLFSISLFFAGMPTLKYVPFKKYKNSGGLEPLHSCDLMEARLEPLSLMLAGIEYTRVAKAGQIKQKKWHKNCMLLPRISGCESQRELSGHKIYF